MNKYKNQMKLIYHHHYNKIIINNKKYKFNQFNHKYNFKVQMKFQNKDFPIYKKIHGDIKVIH